jgi:hypothetical protein
VPLLSRRRGFNNHPYPGWCKISKSTGGLKGIWHGH